MTEIRSRFRIMKSPLQMYLFAFLVTVGAFLLTLSMWPMVERAPFLLFFAAVALSAWRGMFGPGLFAGVLSLILIDLFLTDPINQFSFYQSPSDSLQYMVFFVVTLLVSWLAKKSHDSEHELISLTEELHVILNNTADGIIAEDAKGRLIFVNKAAANLMELPLADQISGQQVNALDAPVNVSANQGKISAFLDDQQHKLLQAGQNVSSMLFSRNQETGEEHLIKVNATPVFDERKNVRRIISIFRDVSDEIKVDEQRARLASLVEHSEDVIISKSLNGLITSWNPAAERLYGYSHSEAIGQSISLIIPEEILDQELQIMDKIGQGETAFYHETQRIAKSGKVIDVALTLSPIRDWTGAITGYSSIARDITLRRQLAKVQEDNALFLRKILDTLPIMVGVMTPDGVLIEANQMALAVSNVDLSEVLNKPLADASWLATITESREWIVNSVKEAGQGNVCRDDLQVRTADGKNLTVDFIITPMYDDKGRVTHLIPAGVDITERQSREQQIETLSERLQAQTVRLNNIIANIPGIVFEGRGALPDGIQEITFVSSYVETLLGYPPDVWRNSDFFETIVHPKDFKMVQQWMNGVYISRKTGRLEFRCITQDEQVVLVECHQDVITDDNGHPIGICGVIMDITQRKRVESSLASYVEELRQSNQELEQFAYVASHDLQEPLRMVTSYLQLIEQRYHDKLDADGKEFMDYAVDGAVRMKTLIGDLLAYSQVQRNKAEFAPVNMQDVVQRVLRDLKLVIEDSGAEVTYDPMPEIVANKGQMAQILQNLLTNALKFQSDEAPKIHIGAERKGHGWLFSVKDNGIGIEPEHQERIFVIFQRLHARDRYSGTGIGLAICRKIAEKHGGQIWLESQLGEGTTFYFTISDRKPEKADRYDSN
jgi:PAS domain S-box-containing protein